MKLTITPEMLERADAMRSLEASLSGKTRRQAEIIQKRIETSARSLGFLVQQAIEKVQRKQEEEDRIAEEKLRQREERERRIEELCGTDDPNPKTVFVPVYDGEPVEVPVVEARGGLGITRTPRPRLPGPYTITHLRSGRWVVVAERLDTAREALRLLLEVGSWDKPAKEIAEKSYANKVQEIKNWVWLREIELEEGTK